AFELAHHRIAGLAVLQHPDQLGSSRLRSLDRAATRERQQLISFRLRQVHLAHAGYRTTNGVPFQWRSGLGAGASAASGIPTGYAMIRDFKARIFCNHNDISRREIDAGDQVWVDRMDDFFRRTSVLPPDGDPNEYAAAFEMVYPQERHRRQYIE